MSSYEVTAEMVALLADLEGVTVSPWVEDTAAAREADVLGRLMVGWLVHGTLPSKHDLVRWAVRADGPPVGVHTTDRLRPHPIPPFHHVVSLVEGLPDVFVFCNRFDDVIELVGVDQTGQLFHKGQLHAPGPLTLRGRPPSVLTEPAVVVNAGHLRMPPPTVSLKQGLEGMARSVALMKQAMAARKG